MRNLIISLLILLGVSCSSAKWSVMTYNIRYDNPKDGDNAWVYRRDELVQQVLKLKPHFIGFQEVLHAQLLFLDSTMADHAYIGVGRDDGAQGGEYSPIFYDRELFRCEEQSTFWLSDTPDEVSVGWDAAMERICTYGRFADQEGKICWVFNTHFDHVGVEARKESISLILKRIQELTNEADPVFLVGDFNLPIDSPPIVGLGQKLTNALHNYKTKPDGLNHTFNGFKIDHHYTSIIDHIFYKGDYIDLIQAEIIDNRGGASYLSDHHPVWCLFRNE